MFLFHLTAGSYSYLWGNQCGQLQNSSVWAGDLTDELTQWDGGDGISMWDTLHGFSFRAQTPASRDSVQFPCLSKLNVVLTVTAQKDRGASWLVLPQAGSQ